MKNEFIALPKNITGNELYQDFFTFKLFIHLLLSVENTRILNGCSVISAYNLDTSLAKLSVETSLTENQVQESLSKLISLGEVATVNTNKGLIVLINNYSIYSCGSH